MERYIIGLDIGGTKITGIVYSGKSVVRELTIATPKNLKEFKISISRLLGFLSNGKNVSGIGIGLAGQVHEKTGIVMYCPNIKYLNNFKIRQYFKDFNFRQLRIDNDANCFALAEAIVGIGTEYKNFIGITLGTGIGGGLIQRKRLHRGAHNSAGEAGHIMADFKYDSEHYFQEARNKKNFKKVGEVVGILFANVINLLDVDAIVLGGSVSTVHYKKFLPNAVRTCKKHIVNKKIIPKVLISTLKNSGALGAALLLSEE